MATVLCFGDSNTWGYDPLSGERFDRQTRWTGVLAGLVGPDIRVIEEGLPGRTTIFDDPVEDLTAMRNGAKYLRPCLQSHQPIDLVVLMLGTNDLKARFGLGLSDIAQGVGELLAIIAGSASGPRGGAPKSLAIAPAPLTDAGGLIGDLFRDRFELSNGLARLISEVASKRGARFLDASTIWRVSETDGVHFAASEHARFGAAVAASVREILSGH